MTVVTAVAAIGCLTLILATLLIIANRKLRVFEDPRIDAVEQMLPGANCGACGQPGCRPFAEALVGGTAQPAACTVGDPDQRAGIAAYLGVAVGTAQRRVARLACAGGANVARQRAHYVGHSSCRAAQQVAGGGKGCFWGCLGLGDCAAVCDFDAIVMNRHGLPVVDEARCTACGDCVEVCPRDLFSLQPEEGRLWVACANPETGDELLAVCEVACTACARCEKDAAGNLVRMQDGLPLIDYSLPQERKPIERCPTGAIVWIDPARGPQRGAAAGRIQRNSPLPESAT